MHVTIFNYPDAYFYIVDCPETVSTFRGSPGELITGKVEPPLVNVTVMLDLGGDGQVTTYTDNSGYYRLICGMTYHNSYWSMAV